MSKSAYARAFRAEVPRPPPPERIRRPITLFLSPHLDDAALSLGALIASLPAGEATVATCFTADVAGDDRMAARRGEDVLACSLLGADFEHLDLPDAPARGYDTPASLTGDLDPADAVAPALEAGLRDLLRARAPHTVCSPLGVGEHVDHRRVIAAVARVRDDFPGVRWLRWYDQPALARHRRRYPELSFARRVRGLAEVGDDACALAFAPPAREPDGPLARKLRAAAAYASQVDTHFYEAQGLTRADEPDVEAQIARVLGRREWVTAG